MKTDILYSKNKVKYTAKIKKKIFFKLDQGSKWTGTHQNTVPVREPKNCTVPVYKQKFYIQTCICI